MQQVLLSSQQEVLAIWGGEGGAENQFSLSLSTAPICFNILLGKAEVCLLTKLRMYFNAGKVLNSTKNNCEEKPCYCVSVIEMLAYRTFRPILGPLALDTPLFPDSQIF